MSAEGVAISCAGISKSFLVTEGASGWRIALGLTDRLPIIPALRDISLDVPKGEFVGVVGRNGAGKSTFLRVVGGAYTPTAGVIQKDPDLAALYELGSSGNPLLTGLEFAQRYLSLTGSQKSKIKELVEEVVSFSELGERILDPIRSYSAGMQARLFFACATAEKHDVYLIDEILSVGDSHFQAKCWRRMRSRLTNGASGILVTHDWSAVLKLCRTAYVLDKGRIVDAGIAPDVVRRYLADVSPITRHDDSARFGILPSELHWNTGEQCVFVFSTEVKSEHRLKFVFAIEKLVLGFGWEIIINGIDIPLSAPIGTSTHQLIIPSLPLAPGRYTLSASLVTVEPGGNGARKIYDVFGWLQGNPINIEVSGPDYGGAISMPGSWVKVPR